MHELEAKYWGQVDFVYLDRENPANRDVVQAFGVTYQPVFLFLDENGNIVQRWTVPDMNELQATMDSYLLSNG